MPYHVLIIVAFEGKENVGALRPISRLLRINLRTMPGRGRRGGSSGAGRHAAGRVRKDFLAAENRCVFGKAMSHRCGILQHRAPLIPIFLLLQNPVSQYVVSSAALRGMCLAKEGEDNQICSTKEMKL